MIWGNHFLNILYIYNGLEQQTAYQTDKPLAHSQVELSCIRLGMDFKHEKKKKESRTSFFQSLLQDGPYKTRTIIHQLWPELQQGCGI
jgi:hypothetical protein